MCYHIRCYHSRPEWTWEQWQWRGTPRSPKLQHFWNLTIRLFSVISKTLVSGGGLSPQQKSSRCILQPQPTGQFTELNVKTVLFFIQFRISTQFCSVWPIDRNLSGVTIPGLSGPGSNGNEGISRIHQCSSITGTSPSDCLVSYLSHLKKQSVYSAAPAQTWPFHRGRRGFDFRENNFINTFASLHNVGNVEQDRNLIDFYFEISLYLRWLL